MHRHRPQRLSRPRAEAQHVDRQRLEAAGDDGAKDLADEIIGLIRDDQNPRTAQAAASPLARSRVRILLAASGMLVPGPKMAATPALVRKS